MRVKTRTDMAGAGGYIPAGSEIDMSDDEAARYIARGFAVAISAPPLIETAALRTTPAQGRNYAGPENAGRTPRSHRDHR